MRTHAFGLVAAVAACCLALGASAPLTQSLPPSQPTKPAGHPTPGQPPAGHGQIPAGHTMQPKVEEAVELSDTWPRGKTEDVQSVDAIINAYYATVSGAKGQARDWDRLRSLMLPETKMFSTRIAGTRPIPIVLTVDQYIATNRDYFEHGGYYEREANRKVDAYGNIAQVFSTYESRRNINEPQPYARGINSFQLVNDGERWWIASILWDGETPAHPIPADLAGTPAVPAAPAAPAK